MRALGILAVGRERPSSKLLEGEKEDRHVQVEGQEILHIKQNKTPPLVITWKYQKEPGHFSLVLSRN